VIARDEDSFVHVAPDEESSARLERVDFHLAICIGRIYKGRGLLEAPDPRLLDIGCKVVESVPHMRERVTAYWSALASGRDFESRTTVAGRLRFLRTGMVAALAKDAALERATCARFPRLLRGCPPPR
jgi:hypothetical protein